MSTRPTVVLLHGVGLDHSMWQPVIARMSERFEFITPDLLGHGARGAIDAVTLGQLAEDVVPRITPGSHLVGFSLGALVAQHLTLHHPDLVASLTCVSSVYRRTDEERDAVLQRLHCAERDLSASTTASLARWFTGTTVPVGLVRRTEATLRSNDPGSFLACYRVFATADASLTGRLGDIQIPALAITGSHDTGSTPAMTRRLAEAMPNCTPVIVPGARHMLPLECPEAVAHHVRSFIDTLYRETSVLDA